MNKRFYADIKYSKLLAEDFQEAGEWWWDCAQYKTIHLIKDRDYEPAEGLQTQEITPPSAKCTHGLKRRDCLMDKTDLREEKKCSYCKETKSIKLFGAGNDKNGLYYKCLQCVRILSKKYYRNNVERVTKVKSVYTKSPIGRINSKKSRIRMMEKYPEKYKARAITKYAILTEKIKRKCICEKCGSNKKIEIHHRDYSNPLDIMWLCHWRHRKIEGRSILCQN